MPDTPLTVRRAAGVYDVWSGESWLCRIERTPKGYWELIAAGRRPLAFDDLEGAKREALTMAVEA